MYSVVDSGAIHNPSSIYYSVEANFAIDKFSFQMYMFYNKR